MGRFAATEFWKINWTFQGAHCFVQIEQIAMNKAIARNIQIDLIRAVTGVIIRQLLISIVGFGALFELYAANFLMKRF
jgi:NitT/TauT family transport system permease protein